MTEALFEEECSPVYEALVQRFVPEPLLTSLKMPVPWGHRRRWGVRGACSMSNTGRDVGTSASQRARSFPGRTGAATRTAPPQLLLDASWSVGDDTVLATATTQSG